MIRSALKWIALLLLAIVLGLVALWLWTARLAKTDGNVARPTFEHFELTGGAADGSKPPSATGFIVDSEGDARIVPAMPPERPMDIHTAANNKKDYAIRSCFWPGPRARAGVYTNDAVSIAVDHQFPDTATTYMPTAVQLPAGSTLVIKGEFPHMRHWNYNTYNAKGQPQDALGDDQIEPDVGSSNPFRPGVMRDVKNRRYTIRVVNGMPAAVRPPNTIYTRLEAGQQSYLWMRNYVPDLSADYLGGVPLPTIELQLADGRVLTGEAACAATDSPMRGKQLARTVDAHLWMMLTHLPWIDTENVGASQEVAVPLKKFFSPKVVLSQLFFPWLAPSEPELVGGYWNNKATTYGYAYMSRRFGQVYVLSARMPVTPKTWHGDQQNTPDTDMRYLSVCVGGAPAAGSVSDCVYDEQMQPSVDSSGRYAVVMSRQQDRPANATSSCGVVWMDMGNGDGIVGGSADYAVVINRNTTVNPAFKHSWFAVPKPGDEKAALGDYLPYLLNLKEKKAFEALGCPVDKSRLWALLPQKS